MGLTDTPSANRLHIGFFGKRNSGKSSLINAFVNQNVSIVSDEAGTTTDPVYKAMEIYGLGPCMLVDTAGFDDIGKLGALRNDKTKKASEKIDIAIILISDEDLNQEMAWQKDFKAKSIPAILVLSKADQGIDAHLVSLVEEKMGEKPLIVSSASKEGIKELKEEMIRRIPEDFEMPTITRGIVTPGDLVMLVMPQDIQAPKGRLILPQVQVLRELLDMKCLVMSVTTDKMLEALDSMSRSPDVIITDSQVFKYVYEHLPKGSKLTSFSVLMAGYKGDLKYYAQSVKTFDELTSHSKVLIAECCTHAPLKEDIGREKIPRLLKSKYPGIQVDVVSGTDFPEDLKPYDLVITCGGCMFNRRYIMNRIHKAEAQNVPMTNYGIFIAYVNDILDKIDL